MKKLTSKILTINITATVIVLIIYFLLLFYKDEFSIKIIESSLLIFLINSFLSLLLYIKYSLHEIIEIKCSFKYASIIDDLKNDNELKSIGLNKVEWHDSNKIQMLFNHNLNHHELIKLGQIFENYKLNIIYLK